MQAATARKTAAAKYEMELEFSGLESEWHAATEPEIVFPSQETVVIYNITLVSAISIWIANASADRTIGSKRISQIRAHSTVDV